MQRTAADFPGVTAELAPIEDWGVWRDELADGGDRWYAINACGAVVYAALPSDLLERIILWRPELEPPFRRRGAAPL